MKIMIDGMKISLSDTDVTNLERNAALLSKL